MAPPWAAVVVEADSGLLLALVLDRSG